MIIKLFFNSLLCFFLLFQFKGLSQDIPIGTWRGHLPYSDAVSVAKAGDIVYCATNSAIFTYDIKEKTIDRLNLVNGLSDIGISKIAYVSTNNRIIITYQNGNIDVILEDRTIINVPFIKNSNVIGSKRINHIYIDGEIAYLSTGVGVIVFNTQKIEITDTYNFAISGSTSLANAVALDSLYIYVASDQGVFFASRTTSNLADFNSWTQISELGSLKYNGIVSYQNQLFVSFDSPNWQSDTVFYNKLGVWQSFPTEIGKNLEGLSVSNNKLLVISNSTLAIYGPSLTSREVLFTFQNQFFIEPAEAIIDRDNNIWVADKFSGLIKARDNFTSEQILPNGPLSNGAFALDFFDDELWAVAGGYNSSSFVPNFLNRNLVSYSSKGTWINADKELINSKGNAAFDAVSVAINPGNKNQVFIGTWGDGLFEFNNGIVTKIYTAQNSELDSTFFGSTQIGALAYDSDNNLWINNTSSKLATISPAGNMFSYDVSTLNNGAVTSLAIAEDNTKWIGVQDRNELIVFDDGGTLDDTGDDQFVILTSSNNDIPGAKLNTVVKDLDGEMWIGTDEGIAVFYNPSSVFDERIRAEQIFLQQDGQTQILLETEIITSIVIDGANRKWIGTQTSGVFLMSEDGTEELLHFTRNNSPLFSNNILDITINNKTGEVYFGTSRGLISYKGTATEADQDFNNIFVYPNPVKEDFTGTIAIRGLVEDTDVKITDASGNIVYQTTSLGGQAIWNGNNMNGNRVQTGVYFIFNGSQDGAKKSVAKILFIH